MHSYFCTKYRLWVRLNKSPLTHKIYVLEQNKKIIVNPRFTIKVGCDWI